MDSKMIEKGVSMILKGIGEDINREGLLGTPKRVADMYKEIFSGIGVDPSDELEPLFDENHDEIILAPFTSENKTADGSIRYLDTDKAAG